MTLELGVLLASVVGSAAPIVLASMGETLTERAGVINLSLDGALLLSAMAGFAATYASGSLWLGFLAGAAAGAAVAVVVAAADVFLGLSQVAVGFVLTLTCRDLAYFLGNPFARVPGPQVAPAPIPWLGEIPHLGPIFFRHTAPVYLSFLLVLACWWFLYRTRWGLEVRGVGENPRAAFARGLDPRRVRLLCALAGGALVGLAGATFSLATKPGWGRPQGAEGMGWIVLAIVIFGGWHPLKVALGAYLFAFLQVIGIPLQNWAASVPAQVFQVAPFPLMILALLLVHLSQSETVARWAGDRAWAWRVLHLLQAAPPRALGKPLQRE